MFEKILSEKSLKANWKIEKKNIQVLRKLEQRLKKTATF